MSGPPGLSERTWCSRSPGTAGTARCAGSRTSGAAVGTFTPGTTGSTRLDGIDLENAIETFPWLGIVWANAHTGCVPFGAEIVTRMREPARYAWPS